MRALTFRDRMHEAAKSAAAETADRWRVTLERVRGKVDFYDGLERVSSQTLLDLLEVPQRNRTTGTFRRLAKVMAELGWTAVRVRDLTREGFLEQIRSYCRDARNRQSFTFPHVACRLPFQYRQKRRLRLRLAEDTAVLADLADPLPQRDCGHRRARTSFGHESGNVPRPCHSDRSGGFRRLNEPVQHGRPLLLGIYLGLCRPQE